MLLTFQPSTRIQCHICLVRKNQRPVFLTFLSTISSTELWETELDFVLISSSPQMFSTVSRSSLQISHPAGDKTEQYRESGSEDVHESQTEPMLTFSFTNSNFHIFLKEIC